MKHALRLTWLFLLGVPGLTWADLEFQPVILDRTYIAYERDVGDIDGDVDLLVGGMIQSKHRGLKLLLNEGKGSNWTQRIIQTEGSYSAEIGDIDNDGDLDIVGIRSWNSAPTWIYRNISRTGRVDRFESAALLRAQLAAEPSPSSDPWEVLTVDVGTVLNTTRHHPLGINLDYLMDDDRNALLAPQRPLREALQDLGAKFLRYPGGWKSAINLWSTPPYTSSRPTLAGRVPEAWIRDGLPLTSPDGAWRLDPLDFDEFINLCRTIKAEP